MFDAVMTSLDDVTVVFVSPSSDSESYSLWVNTQDRSFALVQGDVEPPEPWFYTSVTVEIDDLDLDDFEVITL